MFTPWILTCQNDYPASQKSRAHRGEEILQIHPISIGKLEDPLLFGILDLLQQHVTKGDRCHGHQPAKTSFSPRSSPLWTFCRETLPAAKSEEKRMFLQAIWSYKKRIQMITNDFNALHVKYNHHLFHYYQRIITKGFLLKFLFLVSIFFLAREMTRGKFLNILEKANSGRR